MLWGQISQDLVPRHCFHGTITTRGSCYNRDVSEWPLLPSSLGTHLSNSFFSFYRTPNVIFSVSLIFCFCLVKMGRSQWLQAVLIFFFGEIQVRKEESLYISPQNSEVQTKGWGILKNICKGFIFKRY